jgi:two-component system cell cycle sensor histidine kinase/response regulator CckA
MSGVRILIVAQSADSGAALKAAVSALGYGADGPALSGPQAIESSRAIPPHLVLIEAELAGPLDAFQTGSSLLSLGIPLVYIARTSDPALLEKVQAASPFGYLHHPFEPADLKIALEIALFRHQYEARLEHSRRWFTTALDSLDDGLITADREGRINFMNRAAERLTRWTRKEAVGRPIADLGRILDLETQRPVESPALKLLRRGQTRPIPERLVLLLDQKGRRKAVALAAAPILLEPRRVEGVVLTLRDVSRRLLDERHHRRVEKMEALGKLSGTVAREYSRIFGSLTGFASSLLSSVARNTSAYADAQKILDASRLGQDLTRRMMTIARASNTEGDIHLQPVSLKQAVSRAIELAQPTLERQGVEIRFADTGRPTHVMADPAQLVDILLDFLFHRAEALNQGGQIRFSYREQMVKRPDTRANPRAQVGPYAVVQIGDNGTGVPAEEIPHLFDPFSSSHGKEGGMGLGLSVAHTAVLGYGGWITVRSSPTAGTLFQIFLPIAAPQLLPRREEKPLILAIDHEEPILEETAALLKNEGFRVQTARTATEGLALYRKTPEAFSLCMVNAIMPDMETELFMHRLVETKPGAPLIITSGFSRDYLRRFMPACEWTFLQKPFERKALLEAIRRFLEDDSPRETTPA